jgi:hypothetical protein
MSAPVCSSVRGPSRVVRDAARRGTAGRSNAMRVSTKARFRLSRTRRAGRGRGCVTCARARIRRAARPLCAACSASAACSNILHTASSFGTVVFRFRVSSRMRTVAARSRCSKLAGAIAARSRHGCTSSACRMSWCCAGCAAAAHRRIVSRAGRAGRASHRQTSASQRQRLPSSHAGSSSLRALPRVQ